LIHCQKTSDAQVDAASDVDAATPADAASGVDAAAPVDAPGDTGTPGDAASSADAANDAEAPIVLPAPADDTVEMLLNGQRSTLVEKESCKNGTLGIGFRLTATSPESSRELSLHNVDFTATGTVLITHGNGGAWHMDLDADVGSGKHNYGTTDAGCNATVVENSATVMELQALDCNLKNQFGDETAMVSFRVRCTKEP
jgi:hypothetical protein